MQQDIPIGSCFKIFPNAERREEVQRVKILQPRKSSQYGWAAASTQHFCCRQALSSFTTNALCCCSSALQCCTCAQRRRLRCGASTSLYIRLLLPLLCTTTLHQVALSNPVQITLNSVHSSTVHRVFPDVLLENKLGQFRISVWDDLNHFFFSSLLAETGALFNYI